MFDLTNPRFVLAGTAYGECSGGGREGMENVGAVVLQRVRTGWAADVIGVCLAPVQFSCWADINRVRIERASVSDPSVWAMALDVADAALAGTLPDRTCGADSYFALSMPRPAYWARPPAHQVYADRWHTFWIVRSSQPVRHAPNISIHATEDLNAAELARVTGADA